MQHPIAMNTFLRPLLFLLFIIASREDGVAQCLGPLVGFGGAHIGEEISIEAGIGFSEWSSIGKYVDGHSGSVLAGSLEMTLTKDPVYGVRAGVYGQNFLALGIAFGYYTNFHQGLVVFQPELGIGFAEGRVTWRPTIPFAEMLPGMSRNDLTVCIFFQIEPQ